MSIRRVKKTVAFTQISNEALRNPALSLKAKGLLAVMMSCPEDWQFYMSWLEKQSKDGKEAHQNAMKELETQGYVQRERANGEGGRLEWDYFVDDIPHGKPDSTMGGKARHGEAPTMEGFTVHGLTTDGKPATTNTDYTNTDFTNTEKDLKRETAAPSALNQNAQEGLEETSPPQSSPANAGTAHAASERTPDPVQAQPQKQASQNGKVTDNKTVPGGAAVAGGRGEAERFLRRKLSNAFVDRVLEEAQPLGVDRRKDWFALSLERVQELLEEATQTHDAHKVKVPTRFRDLLDEECRRINTPTKPSTPAAGKYDRSAWSD